MIPNNGKVLTWPVVNGVIYRQIQALVWKDPREEPLFLLPCEFIPQWRDERGFPVFRAAQNAEDLRRGRVSGTVTGPSITLTVRRGKRTHTFHPHRETIVWSGRWKAVGTLRVGDPILFAHITLGEYFSGRVTHIERTGPIGTYLTIPGVTIVEFPEFVSLKREGWWWWERDPRSVVGLVVASSPTEPDIDVMKKINGFPLTQRHKRLVSLEEMMFRPRRPKGPDRRRRRRTVDLDHVRRNAVAIPEELRMSAKERPQEVLPSKDDLIERMDRLARKGNLHAIQRMRAARNIARTINADQALTETEDYHTSARHYPTVPEEEVTRRLKELEEDLQHVTYTPEEFHIVLRERGLPSIDNIPRSTLVAYLQSRWKVPARK